jgi:hypothetical protein
VLEKLSIQPTLNPLSTLQAYQVGKKLEGESFTIGTFAGVIRALSVSGRASEVEGVLEDYYAARKKGGPREFGTLRMPAFNRYLVAFVLCHDLTRCPNLAKLTLLALINKLRYKR